LFLNFLKSIETSFKQELIRSFKYQNNRLKSEPGGNKMDKKVIFGLLGLAILSTGLFFVSAALKTPEEKITENSLNKNSLPTEKICGGASGCGSGSCDGSCGGECQNPDCGCAKKTDSKVASCGGASGCGSGSCDGSCGGNCGSQSCGCKKV
jgi:hypothetical protein